MSNTIQITEAMVDAGCKAIIDLRGHGKWPADFSLADQSIGRQNIRAALEAALSIQAQDAPGREKAKAVFEHGYVIACCNLVHLHDEPGLAFDTLSELGVTKEAVTAMGLTDYDMEALRQIEEARNSQQLYAPLLVEKEEPAQ
ncbi:hypothetical protein G6M86_06575 [Agrobacterium tumefaciens]|uniref:Uncharacterized protein n=1 Tax=Agrobacterium tumefaciens TaxID=358 RepID=A0AAJ4N0W7_AGRTU|nr:hypothetical protein G6M86_06575 [Agrobacterium tumefaciens]